LGRARCTLDTGFEALRGLLFIRRLELHQRSQTTKGIGPLSLSRRGSWLMLKRELKGGQRGQGLPEIYGIAGLSLIYHSRLTQFSETLHKAHSQSQ